MRRTENRIQTDVATSVGERGSMNMAFIMTFSYSPRKQTDMYLMVLAAGKGGRQVARRLTTTGLSTDRLRRRGQNYRCRHPVLPIPTILI